MDEATGLAEEELWRKRRQIPRMVELASESWTGFADLRWALG